MAMNTSKQAVELLPQPCVAEGDRHQDDQQQVREGIHDVREAHQDVVDATAEPAGNGADRHADDEHYDLDHQRDGQADLGSIKQSAQ